MEFQIFQDIPQRLTELHDSLVENVHSATYHWTLCLYGHQTMVLNVLNMSDDLVKLLNQVDDSNQQTVKKMLENEITYLTTILPRGVQVNGVISVLQDEKYSRSPAFNTFLKELNHQVSLVEEQIKQVFACKVVQFLYAKNFKPYMQEMQVECLSLDGSKLKVSALKHSSTNDVLKSYYQLTTFFRYPSDCEPLNLIMFAKVNNDFTILPRGSPCIVQVDNEEPKEEIKSSGKSKKPAKQNTPVAKETNQEKMVKIIQGFKTENKKNTDEVGKGIALIKVQTVEVSIYSRIHQPKTQETLTIKSTIQNQQKFKYVDCVSYVKNDTADHEAEIQNHLLYFFEQIRQTEGKSIYVYGLLDLPLCTQGVIDVVGNEPSVESKKELHYRNLLPSSFASFRQLDRLQNTQNIGFYKKEKIRNVHKFMPLKAGKNFKNIQNL